MTFDDELIGAYLDGELNEIVRLRLEDAAKQDPALRERLRAQERLRTSLAAHFAPVLAEPVPQRLAGLLEGREGNQVVSIEAARERRSARRLWVPAAMAASLAAGLFAGQMLPPGPGPGQDPLVAEGQIAQALDTQLASAPPAAAAVRVGVTFRDGAGHICRTFDGAQAGLACREGDGWRLRLLAPGSAPQPGEFAQAGSGPALVLQAAQEAMAGEPMGAQEERQAHGRGWR